MAEISKSDAGFLGQFEPDVFWELHGRKVIAGLIAVLVLGLVIAYWRNQRAEEQVRAAARLATARDPNSLQSIIRDYPGQQVAAQALLRLGDLYFQQRMYADSSNAYQQFLASYSHDDQAPAALLGLAAIEEAGGNFANAKDQYNQLFTSHPGAYTAIAAKLGAARCALQQGQKKEARQLYEELLPVVQDTQWQMEAQLGWTVLSREAEQTSITSTVPAPLSAPAPGLELQMPDKGQTQPEAPSGGKAP